MRSNRNPTRGSEALRAHIAEAEDPARERERLATTLRVDVMTIRRWEWGDRAPSDRNKFRLRDEVSIAPGDWYVAPDDGADLERATA